MKAVFLLLCVYGFLTACTTSKAKYKSIEDVYWRKTFYAMAEQHEKIRPSVPEGRFSMSLVDRPLFYPKTTCALSYPWMTCTPIIENFPSGNQYYLYCPHTGCPLQPELMIEIRIDAEGNGQVEQPSCLEKLGCGKVLTYINLYAIPGYETDWYLLSKRFHFIRHTRFTYQPIRAIGPDNQELIITKKEIGGNLIRVEFKGFEPNEQLSYYSDSEGELMCYTAQVDNEGYFSFDEYPQVNGKTKGIVKITVVSKKSTLVASCDWDMATLSIKRVQKESCLKELPLEVVSIKQLKMN